jgi:hypothetical protein
MDVNGDEPTERDPLIQYVDDKEPESKQNAVNIICDPRKFYYRYFALIFMCMLGFGSYFCYDNPAALQEHFKKDLKITTSTFTAFYSWYSWPNVVLCFLGGYLIDRVFGIRLGAIVFGSMVLFGQIIFGFGALYNLVWLMDVGRFIFG